MDIEQAATAAGLDLREMARQYVLSAAEELDYGGVGERFEEELDRLGDDAFSVAQERIHDLARSAKVIVVWDDENSP